MIVAIPRPRRWASPGLAVVDPGADPAGLLGGVALSGHVQGSLARAQGTRAAGLHRLSGARGRVVENGRNLPVRAAI